MPSPASRASWRHRWGFETPPTPGRSDDAAGSPGGVAPLIQLVGVGMDVGLEGVEEGVAHEVIGPHALDGRDAASLLEGDQVVELAVVPAPEEPGAEDV